MGSDPSSFLPSEVAKPEGRGVVGVSDPWGVRLLVESVVLPCGDVGWYCALAVVVVGVGSRGGAVVGESDT